MLLLRFTRGDGLAGAIVRWATWSSYGHVGFKFTDTGKVLDATPQYGVSLRDAVDDEYTEYWRILAPTRVLDGAAQWALSQRGKPYDWTAIYGFAFRQDWHEDTKFFCSELTEGAMDYMHWPLVRSEGRHLNRITPRDEHCSTRIERIRYPLTLA